MKLTKLEKCEKKTYKMNCYDDIYQNDMTLTLVIY